MVVFSKCRLGHRLVLVDHPVIMALVAFSNPLWMYSTQLHGLTEPAGFQVAARAGPCTSLPARLTGY